MKRRGKILGWLLTLVFVTSFMAISCSDDDSPADSDIFIGRYNGTVSYSNGESTTQDENGWVEVVKVGNNYNFLFSNGIPEITGVEFESDGETLINIGATEFQYIRVTAGTLQILYTENVNDVWTANCTRN
ncbi:hypothetical protein [Moheibacter sp.]|jgi:hypothetical protein|uniref:hypothetical protein n=1 Tax=Moheibacter sp. TaxID=1965316 RepID=UPI00169148F4|nr:hypothetical protein [Flavobacteriaceae bacterium]